jgi:CBS domain containing-hemolysin-like protein
VSRSPIARHADGTFEILGTTHVSQVNQELGLNLPEEEAFETLAGFVLARFGRFPRRGERFEHEGVSFVVTEASEPPRDQVEVAAGPAGRGVRSRGER